MDITFASFQVNTYQNQEGILSQTSSPNIALTARVPAVRTSSQGKREAVLASAPVTSAHDTTTKDGFSSPLLVVSQKTAFPFKGM